ncbi:hypothetical protein G3435_23760, partial [Pseudomonas sp. MAFF212428]|nr:hypothetical protein [Pseudomonas brassicae]
SADGDGASRWSQWWAQISRYFRIDFDADKNVKPLLAGQALNQVRLALSLTLEQAQWAALNGEPKVYAQALDEARSVLLANFNHDNEQSQSMLEQLNAVAGEPVSVVTPDLADSLNAVQAYLERATCRPKRRSPGSRRPRAVRRAAHETCLPVGGAGDRRRCLAGYRRGSAQRLRADRLRQLPL